MYLKLLIWKGKLFILAYVVGGMSGRVRSRVKRESKVLRPRRSFRVLRHQVHNHLANYYAGYICLFYKLGCKNQKTLSSSSVRREL